MSDESDRLTEIMEASIAYTRAFYDEAIFPPRPRGRHSEVYDAEAAAVARLTCDNILREFRKRLAGQSGD